MFFLCDSGEQDGELSKLEDVPAAKRRMVRRPQPKLDSQRYSHRADEMSSRQEKCCHGVKDAAIEDEHALE